MPDAPTHAPPSRPSRFARARLAAYAVVTLLATVSLLMHPDGWGATRRFFLVASDSMSPFIRSGDVVDLDAYEDRLPERGDVVVFELPSRCQVFSEDRPRVYVKRVVGLPGDIIEVRDHRLRINGTFVTQVRDVADEQGLLQSVWIEDLGGQEYEIRTEPMYALSSLPDFGEAPERRYGPVPEGHVFVLGDHRANSRDSRSCGPIERSAILGRVVRVEHPDDSRLHARRST